MPRGEKTYIVTMPGVDPAAVASAAEPLGEEFAVVDDLRGRLPAEHLVIQVAAGEDPQAELDRARRMEAEEGWRYLGLILSGLRSPARRRACSNA